MQTSAALIIIGFVELPIPTRYTFGKGCGLSLEQGRRDIENARFGSGAREGPGRHYD